jgi:hypothetical protein
MASENTLTFIAAFTVKIYKLTSVKEKQLELPLKKLALPVVYRLLSHAHSGHYNSLTSHTPPTL